MSKQDEIRDHTSGYTAELDALRKTVRWQAIRRRVIQEQPLCARCQLRISELADHIIPAQVALQQVRDSGKYADKSAGYFFRSNLQGLCRKCHYDKTLEDKTHTGTWPDVIATEQAKAKRKWCF